ncbi:DUF3857 domain-containing protein [Mariprofundus micogutta]|nr:DUF3857 domain-containing protein [Mariprofundus micogutta]
MAILLLMCSSTAYAASLAPSLKQQSSLWGGGDGAEVLHAIQKVIVREDKHWEEVQYYSIQVNDLDAARDYGRIVIPYNHYYNNIELEFANVLSDKGVIKAVASDAIQRRDKSGQDFYSEDSELAFSLPDISPGSIIEFQFRIQSEKLTMPDLFYNRSDNYWFQPTAGGDGFRADPVREASYELNLPKQMQIHIKEFGPGKTDYDVANKANRQVHMWSWDRLPAISIEGNMPDFDTLRKRIRVSTSKQWMDVDSWSWNLVRDKFQSTSAVSKLAKKIARPGDSRDKKIRAVYAYLQQNIRYVYAHLGRGGYEPHIADEIIQKQYGDCKDQTILAVSLLRELGIDAYPALIATRRVGQPDMDMVHLSFDHMIVHIPQADDGHNTRWMDTTSDRGLFPGIYNSLLDQPVFVLNGHGGKLTTIQQDDLYENLARLEIDFTTNKNGSLNVVMNTFLSGEYEQYLRDWWLRDHNRKTNLNRMVSGLFTLEKGDVKVDAEVLHHNDLWKPIAIKAEFNLKSENGKKEIFPSVAISQVYRMFNARGVLPLPASRENDWLDKQPHTLQIKANFHDKKRRFPVVVHSGGFVDNDYYVVTQRGEKREKEYSIFMEFKQKALSLSPKGYKKYYYAIENLHKNSGSWLIAYDENEKNNSLAELKAKSEGEGGEESKLKLARHYIKQGQFEEALRIATAVVELDKENGQAWYILGVAQGYNAMISESTKSFTQATTLGYTP